MKRVPRFSKACGDHLVAAELCRRRVLAYPIANNEHAFDLMALGQNGTHLPIQIKATRSKSWNFYMKSFMHIDSVGDVQIPGLPAERPLPDLHVVLVAIGKPNRSPDRFFVLEWTELRDIMNANYSLDLNKRGGVPKIAATPYLASLSIKDLSKHEDRWDILVAPLTSSP